jgi:hypothetical protein
MAAQSSSLLVVTQVGATEHDILLFPKSYVWVCPEGVTYVFLGIAVQN